jgi:hypothetical protein
METYRTTDLYLSAFLKTKGLRLIDRQRFGNKVSFVFQDRKDRSDLISDFLNDGTVGVASYKSALQDLKVMLFNID